MLNIDAAGALTYTATPTLANDLTISVGTDLFGTQQYTFQENGESINVTGADSGNCAGSGTGTVTCPTAAVSSISVDVGDMDDKVTVQSVTDPITVLGGAGNDTVDASGASDPVTVDGGTGDDSLVGGSGHDSLIGGTGNDTAVGGAGNDTITGGAGDDSLTAGTGTDRLVESGDTNMTLTNTSFDGQGLLGHDMLRGFEQASLTGGTGNNTLDASAFSGSVTLDGGAGNDSLAGGSGTGGGGREAECGHGVGS